MGQLTSIPPPSTGFWGWVRDELKTKADEKWVQSELNGLRRNFDDTKLTADDAKKRAEQPYACQQQKEIDKLTAWQDKVTNWKIPVIISVVVLIIGAAGQYFSLKDSVEDGNADREEVQKTLLVIQEQQEQTSQIVEDLKQQTEIYDETRKQELREILKEVINDTDTKKSSNDRRRNREER